MKRVVTNLGCLQPNKKGQLSVKRLIAGGPAERSKEVEVREEVQHLCCPDWFLDVERIIFEVKESQHRFCLSASLLAFLVIR